MKTPPILAVSLLLLAGWFGPMKVEAAVALNELDSFVVAHGFGGAQFVRHENTYRLPIIANGKVGDLTIDTGASTSVIFRAALKKFGLTAEGTETAVHGVFGRGREKVGLTTIHQLAMGNCVLLNVRAVVVSDPQSGALYRAYGLSDGLFGLREMLKYGAVLDIGNRLLLVHPGGQMKSIAGGIRSILTKQGFTPIDLSVVDGHLRVAATINGTACQLIVDTGAFLTALDEGFARQARIGSYASGAYARGLGTNARPIRTSRFPEFKVGDFMIKNASVTVTSISPQLLGAEGKQRVAGLLGAEYLGLHGAVFDFNGGTLYLRSKK